MSQVRKRILVEILSVFTYITKNASSLTKLIKTQNHQLLVNMIIISYFMKKKVLHAISDKFFFCLTVNSDRKGKHKFVRKYMKYIDGSSFSIQKQKINWASYGEKIYIL